MVHKTKKVMQNKSIGMHKSSSLQKQIDQTKNAYADIHVIPNARWGKELDRWWDSASKKRKLEWKGTSFLTPKQWQIVAKKGVGDYGKFDPDKVYNALKKFKGLEVSMARDVNPAIYIKYGDNDPTKIAHAMKHEANATETNIDVGLGQRIKMMNVTPMVKKKGQLRVWWG